MVASPPVGNNDGGTTDQDAGAPPRLETVSSRYLMLPMNTISRSERRPYN